MATVQAEDRLGRIESLLAAVEALPDPEARATANEVTQALLEFYGEGLSRLVGHVAERDDGSLAEAVAADDVVAHMLLLHGLHPVPLQDRVQAALDQVKPYLGSHGGSVELVAVQDGVVRVRLAGSCSGCPSSARTLELAIEDAVLQAAPDVERIEAEGIAERPEPLLAIENARAPGSAGWSVAAGAARLEPGAPRTLTVRGEPVLFVRVDGAHYAYKPRCPACGEDVGEGSLDGARLACAACGARYDIRGAGLAVDRPDLQLEPVPLRIEEGDRIAVALGRRG